MNTPRNKSRDQAEAGGRLHLAATPVFAAMALITGVTNDDPASMLCRAMGHGLLSLDGMSVMYLLMAIFHAAPWWQWILLRTCKRTGAEKGSASSPAAVESRWR